MDKTLDVLTVYFRALILVSATVLIIAVGQTTSDLSNDKLRTEVECISATVEAMDRLEGEVLRDATARYQSQLKAALSRAPAALRARTTNIRFEPDEVSLEAPGRRREVTLPFGPRHYPIHVNALGALSRVQTASYSRMEFTPNALLALFETIDRNAEDRVFLDAKDLIVTVIPPDHLPTPDCILVLESKALNQDRQLRRFPVACRRARDDVALEKQFAEFKKSLNFPQSLVADVKDLPLTEAASVLSAKLKRLEEQDVSTESVEFLGPKLGAPTALKVAPFLIVMIALMMVAPIKTLKILNEKEPSAGASWFGQFVSFQAYITFVPFVVLPTAASFVSAYLSDILPTWIPLGVALLGGLAALLPVGLLYAQNVQIARRWKTGLGGVQAKDP